MTGRLKIFCVTFEFIKPRYDASSGCMRATSELMYQPCEEIKPSGPPGSVTRTKRSNSFLAPPQTSKIAC